MHVEMLTMRGAIVTVAAQKGGVGKTTLSFELAAALDAVLIDLDFHGGGASNQWGFNPRAFVRAPLLDALETLDGAAPRIKRSGKNKPDLVPSHPDLSAARLEADDVASALGRWAEEWERPVVVDTHPGAHWSTDGAIQVADSVVIPVPPGQRELAATEMMLDEYTGYPVLLVPNMVPSAPPLKWIDALEALAQRENVVLGPFISEHRWLRRRILTTAVTRQGRRGKRTELAANEFEAVARKVSELCQQPIQ